MRAMATYLPRETFAAEVTSPDVLGKEIWLQAGTLVRNLRYEEAGNGTCAFLASVDGGTSWRKQVTFYPIAVAYV